MARDLFRKNLKYYREKQDLYQKELSRFCNYDRSWGGDGTRGKGPLRWVDYSHHE